MSILVIICTPYSEKGIDGGAVQDVIRNRLSRAFIIATALIVGGQMMYFFCGIGCQPVNSDSDSNGNTLAKVTIRQTKIALGNVMRGLTLG